MSKLEKLKQKTKKLAPIFMAVAVSSGCSTMNVSFDKVDSYENGRTIPVGDISHYEFKYQLYSNEKLQGYDIVNDGKIHGDLIGYYTDPQQNYQQGVWSDLSGKGYDLGQADPMMRPDTNGFGHQQAVAFDGIDDYLQSVVYGSDALDRDDGFTVILVGQTTRQGDDPVPGPDLEGMVTIGDYAGYTARGKVNMFHHAEEPNKVVDMSHGIGSSKDYRDTDGETFIYVVRGQKNWKGKDSYLGMEQVNSYSRGKAERVQDEDLQLTIGANLAYNGSRMQGKIASLTIYNAPLSDERLVQAVSWTAQKYQLDTTKVIAKILEPESLAYLPQEILDDCAADDKCVMKDSTEMEEKCAPLWDEKYKPGVTRCFDVNLPMLGQITGTTHDHITGLVSRDSDPVSLQETGALSVKDQIVSLKDLEDNYDAESLQWRNTAELTKDSFHATRPAECDMPELDTINGRAALKFDGVNHCLHIPDLDSAEMDINAGYTYFMAVELPVNMVDPTPNSGFNAILSQGEYRNGTDRPNILLNQTRNEPTKLYDLSKGRGAASDAKETNGLPVILSVVVEPNGGAKHVYMGRELITSTSSTQPTRVNTDNYHLYIGGEPSNTARRMFGKVGAVEVYKGALSEKAHMKIVEKLKTDFGITYDVPPVPVTQPNTQASTPVDQKNGLAQVFTNAQIQYDVKSVAINNDNQISMKAVYKPFG